MTSREALDREDRRQGRTGWSVTVRRLDETDDDISDVTSPAERIAMMWYPRASGDIDIFVRPSPEDAARVWRSLLLFGAPLAAAGVVPADFEKPELVYQIGLPPRRIDVPPG